MRDEPDGRTLNLTPTLLRARDARKWADYRPRAGWRALLVNLRRRVTSPRRRP